LDTVLETYPTFKNFPSTEPATTKVGVIPNLLFWLKLEEWRQRDLEIKNKIEIKKQQVDKLPWKDCFDFEKHEIKKLIEKTDGYFKIETYQKYLDRIQQPVFEQEIEQARVKAVETAATIRDSVFWSTVWDGGRYFFKNIRDDGSQYVHPCDHFVERAHVHKRNNSIFKIRLKYLNEYKTHSANYENRGQYYYKDPKSKAYRKFLKEVEQKGLTRKAEVKQTRKEVYDPADGVYHYNVSLLKRNTNSRHYKAADDPDICNNYFYNEETRDYEILREDEL
jgi:hypothetical protein